MANSTTSLTDNAVLYEKSDDEFKADIPGLIISEPALPRSLCHRHSITYSTVSGLGVLVAGSTQYPRTMHLPRPLKRPPRYVLISFLTSFGGFLFGYPEPLYFSTENRADI